ncbi:PKD domain-containing protein [Geobacter sp. AOG2]|uniref:PKD domain-containing protein n=1 Tax=Geobacter sp. AOG2 TaxID=1566347 RepID=UPI001CC40D65|nr:PKD domain-containing protein [Geobacter sp. AOG2]GFE59865.1 cytochrome c [Geobacter sp. AOG2]
MNQNPGNSTISSLNYVDNLSNFISGSSSTVTAGSTTNTGSQFTMVDLSVWDLSTTCGSCHPGGGFVEKDRNGKRFSMMNPAVDGSTPYTMTVFDQYFTDTGLPKHQVMMSPWSYPLYMNGQPVITDSGWGQAMTMTMPDGSSMPVFDKQVMMPNVKEMDCLMCHFDGFNNLMSSVMAYSGAHNATPSFGAGFMNMFTQAYDFTTGLLTKNSDNTVSLAPAALAKLEANPPSQNCRNCHMPSGLKDLPDMMRDFLSSAPMAYTGSFTQSFTGLAMPAFDFNAPFGATWDWALTPYATSPTLYMTMTGIASTTPGFTTTIPAGWPSAMGRSEFNAAAFADFSTAMPGMKQYFLGGGNPAGTGPIYYQASLGNGMQDQNALKKGVVPFPRAEWFKRGDLWAPGYDVHLTLECAGCHMNTNTTKIDRFAAPTDAANPNTTFDGKSLCDPGKGYDSAAGVEGNAAKRTTVNSQNTVKKCENCHVTGKNSDGVAIDTFGAPNPLAAHQNAGLLANITQAVKTTNGSNEVPFVGNHLDVMDCTVCHLAREQMVVRELDSTSGNRYPNMLGFAAERGMLGMFSDPGMGIPANTNLTKWEPLFTWQKNGNYYKTFDNTSTNTSWRRKVYAVNIITAAIWNNVDPAVDANGDGVTGSGPTHHAGDYSGVLTANYDPWIARDLKAGMNFGPSGFAPIPVGFGNGSYQSAYDATGAFTGAWKYVGVYGGNVVFSTPEEISGYKAYRNAIKGSVDNKDWTNTQLALLGGPYKLTHGVRPTRTYVLGTSCADCHSSTPKTSLFKGDFDMLGTAIKTTAGAQFMQSPASQLEVVGLKDDIVTGAELSTKAGGALEVEFDELGTWDGSTFTSNAGGTYKKVKPLDRSEALYPIDGTFTDVKGNTYANRTAWVNNYLANENVINAAKFGIGVKPFANFSSSFTDTDKSAPGIQVAKDAVLPLAAYAAKPDDAGVITYDWTSSDGTAIASGKTSSVTFSTIGQKTITLKVTDESGNVSVATQQVEVVVPVADVITWTDNPGNRGGTITATPLPTPNDKVKIIWGDAKYDYVTISDALSVAKAHTYSVAGNKTVEIYVYKNGIQKGYFKKVITVDGTN